MSKISWYNKKGESNCVVITFQADNLGFNDEVWLDDLLTVDAVLARQRHYASLLLRRDHNELAVSLRGGPGGGRALRGGGGRTHATDAAGRALLSRRPLATLPYLPITISIIQIFNKTIHIIRKYIWTITTRIFAGWQKILILKYFLQKTYAVTLKGFHSFTELVKRVRKLLSLGGNEHKCAMKCSNLGSGTRVDTMSPTNPKWILY